MRKMHDSDSSISEIEWPRRTEKSCIALKSSASVAKQHGTYSDLSSTPNKYAYQSKSQEGWLSWHTEGRS